MQGLAWGNAKYRDRFEDLGVDGSTNITVNGYLWTVFLWLEMKKNDEVLRKLY